MSIILQPVPRFDSRGLPDGYDTESLFQYRYDTLASGAKGVESLLYKYIPISLVRSFCFAIDPTYRYKIAPGSITAANRKRYRATASVLLSRNRTYTKTVRSYAGLSNYQGVSICSSPFLVTNSLPPVNTSTAVTTQPVLPDVINDTTSRTRLIGSRQGELEFFKGTMFSPVRTYTRGWRVRNYYTSAPPAPDCRQVGGVRDYESGYDELETISWGPYGATLPSATHSNLRASEIALCKAIAQKEAISMLKGISPFSRDYSLTRNVAELKDLPKSIASLQVTMADLRKLFTSLNRSPKVRDNIFDLGSNTAKAIPSEYLSYHFGWKQTYKDLKELLELPAKMSKRLNFLIARSGKATTFRSVRDSISSTQGVSGFVYEANLHGWPQSQASRIEREHQTRLVVNGTFDFPPINSPSFRQNFFLNKVGLIPRFIDVYNIIPWTWLVDWFTGLGNYLELIEEINHDPTLINWGVITVNTRGKLITELKHISATLTQTYFENVATQNGWVNTNLLHTSLLEFECQTRQNVANVLDVKQTTVSSSLTGYQLSILGAILASRTGNTRAGTFSPSS